MSTSGYATAQRHLAELAANGIATREKPSAFHHGLITQLVQAVDDLLALAQQYASECGDCNGTGNLQAFAASGHEAGSLECEACADIRAVIAKAVG